MGLFVRELTCRPHRCGVNVMSIESGMGQANATIQQRLVPRFSKLPWIPAERQWLDLLEVARREPVRNRVMPALAQHTVLSVNSFHEFIHAAHDRRHH